MEDVVDLECSGQLKPVVSISELLGDSVGPELFETKFLTLLMDIYFAGVELDLIADLELAWWLAISGHLLFALLKGCFGVDPSFSQWSQALVHCRDIATTAGRDSKVGLIAVHDLEW